MAKKKVSDNIDVHALSPLRLQAFWILDQVGGDERMSATAIARHLVNDFGISTSYQAVDAALQRSGGGAHKSGGGYKLMEKGRLELGKSVEQRPNPGEVIFIESGKPFSAKGAALSSIFGQLSGQVSICDPYIDGHTLDAIFKHIDKSVSVRLLTQVVNDKPTGIISRALQDLQKEGYSVEVRVNSSGTLHDRYIMDASHFWSSGSSLNHLGNKESLIVSLGEDVHRAMMGNFESHWKSASVYR